MTSPGYVALLLVHILSALIGFGALGTTGVFASRLRRQPDAVVNDEIRKYFRPGHNYAAYCILAVPIFGFLLLVFGERRNISAVFPWIGLGLWTVVAMIAVEVIWPAERAIQKLLSDSDPGFVEQSVLASCARRLENAAAVTSLIGVIALVVMIGQPR